MEKLNIAEILKDCPSGMELDCTVYDNVQLDTIIEEHTYPIKIQTPDGTDSLTKYGCYSLNPHCKCVIFPKDKTTWEGFQRPFKDGDVLIANSNALCIYKSIHKTYKHNSFIDYYCGYRQSDNQLVIKKFNDSHFGPISEAKLATEEEKQKLFDAIKANGYKWNAETKTLEKLIEPKFKVGDRVKKNKDYISGIVADIFNDSFKVTYDGGGCCYVQFHYQHEWELVPNKFDITTLKAFESKVLVRNIRAWEPAFWGYYSEEYSYPFVVVGGNTFAYCIPYEGNQHLLGTTDDCDDYYKTWE